jgi:tetratricopeptide (TPR) repeat protein
MELALPYGNRDALQRWADLTPHPCILDVLGIEADVVLLRFAAIAWGRRSSNGQRTVANWGLQLIDAYRHIIDEVPADIRGPFACPLLEIDVARHVRLAFPPVRHDDVAPFLAPELRKSWPRCDELALVYSVGIQLQQLSDVDDVTLSTILQRAAADSKRRRFKTLRELRDALAPFASTQPVRGDDDLTAWRLFEEGVGYLELEMPHTALERLETARTYDDSLVMIDDALREAREQLSTGERVVVPKRARITDAVLCAVHAPSPTAHREPPTPLQLVTHARNQLELGETGVAIELALRALAVDPAIALALDVLVSAHLQRHELADALRSAERFVAAHPSSARARYLLGKVLLGRGNLHDAHKQFAHAIKLDPKLLEAQLLRREVERVIANLYATVGSQPPPTFDIPGQLTELRDVLISGDTNAAISALSADRYTHDADAQLLLARLLAFERRFDEAIALYDQLAASSHRTTALVGKATALFELGRPGDALSIVEQLPDDPDAAELQARALDQLGRLDEAAAAYRRFIALASSGSDLRVRAAQLALDALAQRRRA